MTLWAPKHISLFFHFLREIIAFNIEAKNKDVFRGKLKSVKAILFSNKKVWARSQGVISDLDCFSEEERLIGKSFLILRLLN